MNSTKYDENDDTFLASTKDFTSLTSNSNKTFLTSVDIKEEEVIENVEQAIESFPYKQLKEQTISLPIPNETLLFKQVLSNETEMFQQYF